MGSRPRRPLARPGGLPPLAPFHFFPAFATLRFSLVPVLLGAGAGAPAVGRSEDTKVAKLPAWIEAASGSLAFPAPFGF